ncbi:MAG: leucyl aminopeptidase [Beijerinckiaceae bacterium]
MSRSVSLAVGPLAAKAAGTLVILTDANLGLSKTARLLLGAGGVKAVQRAFDMENVKGKAYTVMTLTIPGSPTAERVLVAGLGDTSGATDFARLGGAVLGALGKAKAATVVMEAPGNPCTSDEIAEFVLGIRLRSYAFDRYKTVKRDETPPLALSLACADPAGVKTALKAREAIAAGVNLARELVNEPPNVLFPAEFAKRAGQLKKLGVEVEILGERQLAKLGMRALLGVGQGSRKESQVAIMRWRGGKNRNGQPVAFIGKGVTFDTGGISIKPAGGMEDMKGDMAGAACVVGLMHALAARKARVNAIGVIGLVENMPDGNAQRPGDIVTAMSGQTIEIINTDAEGRLVLADVLWYTQDRFKPAFMVNLATLTGACIVALGKEHAGLFSNDDELAQRLFAAGQATGDKVWRMPLTPEYDKMIDSKFADVKNTGGRDAGAITAAQFLQRFVNKTPWAHLDIAGPAMGSPQTEVSRSWSSGFGVRLLNRLVEEHYEGREPAAGPAKSARPTKRGRAGNGGASATPASEAVRDTPVGANRRTARDVQR